MTEVSASPYLRRDSPRQPAQYLSIRRMARTKGDDRGGLGSDTTHRSTDCFASGVAAVFFFSFSEDRILTDWPEARL
jgi:hypothetical protein